MVDQSQLIQVSLLVLRIGVGVVFLVHGNAKRKFWKMQPSEQLPAQLLTILKMLAIAEPLAALAVILGVFTRLASVGLCIVMLGAIRMKGLQMHKKLNDDGGWGYDFILLASAIVLVLSGPGQFAIWDVL